MKRLIFFLLVLLASVWIGLQIMADPGYALFAYRNWTVEMPLWLAIIAIILFTLLVYGLLRLMKSPTTIAQRVHAFFMRRRLARSHNLTNRGLIQLAQGHWHTAEKDLINAVVNSTSPLINYLAAARAAQELKEYHNRDHYLELARKSTPDAEIAVAIMQAQFQLNQQHLEPALTSLQQVLEVAPRHSYALRILKDIHIKMNNWQQLAQLLPALRKHSGVSEDEFDELQQLVSQELLLEVGKNANHQALINYWDSLAKSLRANPQLIQIYTTLLISHKEYDLAEEILRITLKKTWDEDLVYLYGKTISTNSSKQLSTAETWLKSHPDNGVLLLTLGRLAVHNKLWGMARHYFENSIRQQPKPETYGELGALLDKIGDSEQANVCYRQGIALSST